MTDPTRWADAHDAATPLEQSLVRAGQGLRMPAEDKDLLWIRILGAIPPVPANPPPSTLGNAAGPTAATAATAPTTLKIVGVILAMVGSGAVAHQLGWWASRAEAIGAANTASRQGSPTAFGSERTAVAPVGTTEPSLAVSAARVLDGGPSSERKAEPASVTGSNELRPLGAAPERSPMPRAAPSPSSTGSAVSAVSLLREESQVVLAARRALRAGDAATGLRTLEQAQQRFGVGVMGEEREALWIEALARSGDRVRASRRAKTFLSSHPKSPHTADVQRYVLP